MNQELSRLVILSGKAKYEQSGVGTVRFFGCELSLGVIGHLGLIFFGLGYTPTIPRSVVFTAIPF